MATLPVKRPNVRVSNRSFLYRAPVAHRPSIHAEQTVYYWWYEFLKRNEDYRRCCERGGKGRMAKLYADFGNVHALSFSHWWQEGGRGERLFAEPAGPIQLQELKDTSEWDAAWTHDSVLVVAVPLMEPKRRIKRWFHRLLAERHTGTPGRPVKRDSGALRKVSGKFSVMSLQQTLLVYDYCKANPNMKQSDVGFALRLVKKAMPNAGDSIPLLAKKRNRMSATISRYLRRAHAMIHHVGNGKFPCAD
jgi:hypothetical protein